MSVEGWKTKALGSVAEIIMGQSPDSRYYSEEEIGLPFLQGCAEFTSKFPSAVLFCSQVKKIARTGSILFSVRAPVGRTNLTDTDYIIGRGLAALIASQISQDYLHHYLVYSESGFRNNSQGSTFEAINSKELRDWAISFPEFLQEQTQIATILSTIDRAIEQTEALITKQQRIKTGLMQDLLTKGIDENGNIRSEETHEFKDSPLGRIPVEWEVKSLQECVEFWDGKRVPLKQSDRDLMQGEIPYYGASGIIDYIDKYIFDEDLILVGEDGENVVSRRLPLCFKITGKSWVNNHAHVLKPVFNANIDFLTERLEFFDYTLLISGSAQPKLNQRNLRNLSFSIPPLSEQKMIASLITNQNRSIKEYETEKEKLMRKKTGLMQDLLTGKVRVTELIKERETDNL